MKDLKNYLHFYLGCEVYVNVSQKQKSYLAGIDRTGNAIVVFSKGNFIHNAPEKIKLILRPLSDMKEQEAKRLGLYGIWEDVHTLSRGKWDNTMFYPEDFPKLLKDNFDLFGLIESELAIDKTKMKAEKLFL